MKKVLFSILLLVIGLTINAQQKIQLRSADRAECVKSDMTSLKANFSFSSLEATNVETKGGAFSELYINGTYPNGNVGDPALPMFTRIIAIPTGATPVVAVDSYSETQYKLSDYGIGTISAMQAPVRKNIHPDSVKYTVNEAAYARNSYNDDPIAMVEVLGTMRGITLGRIIVRPVRYNPVAGTVKVFNDIEMSVDFQNGDAESTARMFKSTSSPAFNSVYGQIFNFDMLTGGTRDAYTDHPDLYNAPVKMLVICYSGFQGNDALNSWLEWKLQKGYYVDIYYTGSGSNNAGTTSSAIASFIKNKYNASVAAGNAYTYLIVIGDTGQVPYYTADYEDYDVGYVASDLGYASVDFSTNSNDVFPDMYYSRMSVENTTHLTNYINKVLTYEKFEFTDGGNYLNNVILVGGWDDTWTSLVARPTINYATTYYFNTSNTTYGGFSGGTIKATIATGSGDNCYTPGYSGTNNGCYQGINDGTCFVNYTAHGDKQEWYAPKMTAAHVATLTNTGKYFFGVGNCCLTGNFNNTTTDYSPGSAIGTNACFAETMIRVPNAGAIAYIGCSDYSIWMEDYYWAVGSGIHFNSNYNLQGTATTSNTTTGVYDAMFRDDYWNSASSLLFVGNIAVTAAENNSNGYDTDAGYRYYFKYYHTFGDGSVMPYVTKPEENTVSIPSAISPSTTTIIVNALAGSYVAVTDNSSVIYGVGVANTSGVATVNFTNAIPNSGTLHVVVTRQQYQPWFSTIEVVNTGEQYEITATVNPTDAGTVEGTGQYYENTPCTLTAVPNHGYVFTNWSNGSTDNPISFTVTGDANFTANFTALEEHQVIYTPQQTHGTISASPTTAYMDDIITLTATPEAGYCLDAWHVTTGRTEIPVENNQFVMPDSDVTVSATFKVEERNLTVADQNGMNETVPFEGYYADDNFQHSQTIYPSTLLTEMQGTQITKLTYYLRDVATDDLTSTFEVRLGTTTQTAFSSGTVNYISMTGAANYTGTIDVTNSSKEVEITLTTPYTYTSGNLVIDIRLTSKHDGYARTYFLGESANTYYSVKSKNSSNRPPFTQGSAVNFMPKTSFTYTPITVSSSLSINAWGEDNGWYLIASPLAGTTKVSDVTNMTSNEFDLYRFNQNVEQEWENYKQEGEHYHFSLEPGKGYLYANSGNVTLTFSGLPYSGNGQVTLSKTTNAEFEGWNLIGNPFNANTTLSQPYYRLNTDGSALNTSTEATTVAAMEGVFVQATTDGQIVTFTPQTRDSEQTYIAQANIMVVGDNGTVIDNAIVRFDGGQTLEKFSFREGSTRIYIPQDGKDYAVACAESMGEIPVNFKANADGKYTISVNLKGMEMAYLHLIDNATGLDIDLLQTPSYTFNSNDCNYDARFKLVFNSNDEDGASTGSASFAFLSNGSLIINNEGEATLQVMDLTGRILSTEEIQGCYSMSLNLSAGVYVVRLCNGYDVKTQKIVVE